MRVTILKQPPAGVDAGPRARWRVGETYDLSANLASLLIVEGSGRLEMRMGAERRRAGRQNRDRRRLRR
jgi:hypothetical protein